MMKYPELSSTVEAIKQLLASKQPVVVAFDGHSGSGKSTLTKVVVKELGAVRIDQDDFYRGGSYALLEAMTDQERADYEMDWQRMRSEVLVPLIEGKMVSYHPFDWGSQEATGLSSDVVTLQPASIIIVDGVFSSRVELQDLVDLSVLINLNKETRDTRLYAREGDGFKDPINELWDRAETYYFTHIRQPESFDIIIDR